MLVGRIASRSGAEVATILAANRALGRWCDRAAGADLAALLSDPSLVRYRRAVEKVQATGRSAWVRLQFETPGRRQGHRCLVAAADDDGDDDATVWLVGEPQGRGSDRALRRVCRRALRQAGTDPLTGLANRRQAGRWLLAAHARASRTGVPLSCLMIDLDRFKAVNDRFGHAVGDRVLAATAEALAHSIRASDQIARYGGDEFLVLLPSTDLAGARAVAARAIEAVSDLAVEFSAPDGRDEGPSSARIRVTASAGAAEGRPGEPAARLLERADAALLQAKAEGRDRVVALA